MKKKHIKSKVEILLWTRIWSLPNATSQHFVDSDLENSSKKVTLNETIRRADYKDGNTKKYLEF